MYPPVSFENASLRREIESLRKKIELLSEESTNADVVAHYEGIKASLEGRIRTMTSWKDKEVKWKKNAQRELKLEKDKRRRLDRELLAEKKKVIEKDKRIAILKNDLEFCHKNIKHNLDKEEEYKSEINALKDEIARLNAILDTDGTNSGTPTSRTPIDKKKVIPNSRKPTGRKKGGQPGHVKRKLDRFKDNEVTSNEIHLPGDTCPKCGGNLKKGDREKNRDEFDYEVRIIKHRHHFPECTCVKCGHKVYAPTGRKLMAENQYGCQVQAHMLSLMNEGFVSMKRTCEFMSGMTNGEINPSEGYAAKLQKRAAKGLAGFVAEVEEAVRKKTLLYWDDTVIFVNTNRACMRFYGDERVALYTAHLKKNVAGLDEDRILMMLSSATKVMHDHYLHNYNKKYRFENIECNEHLKRDLLKSHGHSGHPWSRKLHDLIEEKEARRKELKEVGKEAFEKSEIKDFESRFAKLISEGIRENEADPDRHYTAFEKSILDRFPRFYNNYFMWIYDFLIPVNNNLSERSLRLLKSKLKISGQFLNIEYAKYFAAIRTYTETCDRNGILPQVAIRRLMEGKPFTLKDVLAHGNVKMQAC